MAEWARITNTTIKKYLRGEEEAVMRRRVVMAALKNRGRILYNQGGDGIDWKVRYRRAPMVVNNGEQTIDFSRQNRHKTAFLDYEGYVITDQMTKREKLKNKKNEAIVKVWGNLIPLLMEDLEDQFAEEIYVDVSGTNNSSRMSGIESMMALNGTTTITSGAQRAANAADVVGYPNDTYATLTTGLGDYGGSWGTQSGIDSTWPFGSGDAHFDFFSPVVVNYTSTAFDGSDTWATQAVQSTRFGIEAINSRNMKGGKSAVDACLLDRGLFRSYKDQLDSKERIAIDTNSEMRALGFKDVISQDGVEITSEYGMPVNVGYLWSLNCLEFRSMQDKIFEAEGPYYAEEARAWRVAVDCLGQFKFQSPRNFGKLAALA